MSKNETLEYKVLLKEESLEIRRYFNFYIVEYNNKNDPKISGGFGTLFKYISSDNKDNQKISMTTPVIEEISGDSKKMAFVVPREFGDEVPQPKNPNLNIKKFDEGLFAAIQYSGFSTKSKEDKMKKRLSEWIENKGYQKVSNYMLAFYDPPFRLFTLRRNEIWVRVIKVENQSLI